MTTETDISGRVTETATDILKDNQDTIVNALKDGQTFQTTARLDLSRAFYEHMGDTKYSLQDAVDIISAFSINSEISEMWGGVTPTDALILQATETLRCVVWSKLESIYTNMVDAFEARQDDMKPENAALSAFEVMIQSEAVIQYSKQPHDPIHQCMHCSANLFKVGIIEVCIGGTAETKISFVKDSTESEETQILHMDGSYIRCAKCNKKIDGTFEDLLDIYLNNHSP